MKRLQPWVLAGLLLAPSAWWVSQDRSVWSWDPAFYAMDTADLWFVLTHHPGQWPARMLSVFQAKAPGIAWLGQFFVPLGRWLGSVESGLLASVLLCQAATLTLVFRLGRRLAPGSVIPAVAGALLVAASPLFVASSHHYLTEALQLFSVAYLYWIAVSATEVPPLRILLHLLLAGAIGLLARLSTPPYVLFPGALALYRAARGLRRAGTARAWGAPEISLGVAGVVVGGAGLGWYLKNGKAAWEFAKLASSSDVALNYGHRAPVLTKLGTWMAAIGRNLFVPASAWLLLILAALAGLIILRRGPDPRTERHASGDGLFVVALVAQLALVLAVLSTTINEGERFLLPLAPLFAAALVWVLGRLGSRRVAMAVLLLLGVQWAFVNARQLGVLPPEQGEYWSRAPASETAKMRDVEATVRATCSDRTSGRWSLVGVDLDWLNHYTLMFYSTKMQLVDSRRCYYAFLGYALKDPGEAMKKLRGTEWPYFISLEPSAMPQPPDFLNQVAAQVFDQVAHDPEYLREPFTSSTGIGIFRRREP